VKGIGKVAPELNKESWQMWEKGTAPCFLSMGIMYITLL
jgi:hypothetical protein